MELSLTLGIAAGISIFSFLAFSRPQLMERFIMSPYLITQRNEWPRLLVSGFLHADWGHLLFNMIALFFFGRLVESFLGPLHLAGVFLSGILIGNLAAFPKHKDNPAYRALGASGGVAAVLFCSIIFFPQNEIIIFPIPIPIKAYFFAPLYLIYSHYQAKRGSDNIAHDAHLYGSLAGVVYAFIANTDEAIRMFDKIMASIG